MKKLSLIMIILIVIFISSCDFYYQGGLDYIEEPKSKMNFLNGRWKIDENRSKIKEPNNIMNVYFKENLVFLSKDIYSEKARYQFKKVDTRDYLMYKHRVSPEFLDIETDDLNIINIYEGEEFLKELIIVDNSAIIIKKDGNFLYFKKDKEGIKSYEIAQLISNSRREKDTLSTKESGNTGFLLGLKRRSENNRWLYRTLYININNMDDIEVFSRDNILLPRRDGFYNISVKHEKLFDHIYINSLDNEEYKKEYKTNDFKNILYVGNDYISLQKLNDGSQKLRVMPIDYLEDNKYIDLKDILEDKTFERIEYDIKNNEDKNISKKFDSSNFGLRRRRGYWSLYSEVEAGESYKSFNIRALTPKSIVNYDDLPLIWESIESQIPRAEDAFISPDGDFIVTYEVDNLSVYAIRDGKILKERLFKYKISPEERVIMSEWATSLYSKIWREYF